VARLPEASVADHVVAHGHVLSATSSPGAAATYCLVDHSPWLVLPYHDIVRLRAGAEPTQLYVGKGHIDFSSSIALSPDGSAIAFVYRPQKAGADATGPWRLVLIDTQDGLRSEIPGSFRGTAPLWVRDGQSLLLTRESADADAGPEIVCVRVPADGEVRVVARGSDPVLACDGNTLLCTSLPSRQMSWSCLDGSSPSGAPALSGKFDTRRILAVGPEFVFPFLADADSRLPLERSGYAAAGPYYRGGISVGIPSTQAVETLFVGVAPFALEWRWD